jgi:hypothetical protein
VFAETLTSFQVGVALPFDTMTNLISMLIDSGFAPPPPPPPPPPPDEELDFCGVDGMMRSTNIAPTSQSSIPRSLSMMKGELEAGVIPLLIKGSLAR